MKISALSNNTSLPLKGFWTNKTVLKGLEIVSDHGAAFTAGLSFVMASGIRPLALAAAPDVKKENKQHVIASSIISGAVKLFFSVLALIPVEQAVKLIKKNPEKFLKKTTIETFKNGADSLSKSRNFNFISQVIKLGAGLLAALPKSHITAALIPVITVKLFGKNDKTPAAPVMPSLSQKEESFQGLRNKSYAPSFKNKFTYTAAKGIGKLLDAAPVQKAAAAYSFKDTDIARNMSIASDILLSASFAKSVYKNKKIKKECKKPLILNSVYGTAASIIFGYAIDEKVKKHCAEFTAKFKELHKNDPKLPKYIEGINIVRPALIFAGIYYLILPVISAYFAQKTCSLTDALRNNPAENKDADILC